MQSETTCENVVLRYFLAPQDSCLLKHVRQCTLHEGSISRPVPTLPAPWWGIKGERGMKEDVEKETELGGLNKLSFQYRAGV